MIVDQLRELRTRKPFRPFEVHLNDGNRFRIRGPMDLMVTRAGDIALVDDQDVLHILNHIQITQVTMSRARSKPVAGGS